METFDIERKTKNLDNYVKNVQTNKRSVMEILNKPEPLYDENNEELICLICLDNINNKDFIKLDCNHYYHLSCQNKWENKSKKMGCCVCVK
jgi:predicted AlkP superfamily phosphohydrolase/phosphomutase